MRVAVVHPDLGIGGAERLIVDAALGLQSRGHKIDIYTSHHDKSHCFKETRDGTLNVVVWGDFLPRSLFGRLQVLFAILRNLYLSLQLLVLHRGQYDVILCDQISASIPILKLTGAKILFYCHFPDQLLSPRTSMIKKIYRIPFDVLEEWTTGMAHGILVNSKFTQSVFHSTFKAISKRGINPGVLYPSINFKSYDVNIMEESQVPAKVRTGDLVILSINRFERKKNVGLAIQALAHLRDTSMIPVDIFSRVKLIIGGGYDENVLENKEYFIELKNLSSQLGFSDEQVSFRPSFSEKERSELLRDALFIVYTPSGEHFGIVPVESMYSGRPVVAVNDAGPKESVLHEKTGYLCEPTPADFAAAYAKLLTNPKKAYEMGRFAHQHAKSRFSLESFAANLEQYMDALFDDTPRKPKKH